MLEDHLVLYMLDAAALASIARITVSRSSAHLRVSTISHNTNIQHVGQHDTVSRCIRVNSSMMLMRTLCHSGCEVFPALSSERRVKVGQVMK